jgi:hypothetical protein
VRFLDLPDEPEHPERASVDGADRSTPKRRELPDPDERGNTYEAMRAHASAETAGESSDATGESQHDQRPDGAGQRGYRNEVPRFMEMWANHERRWPETPRHAADPTSPDRDGGQRIMARSMSRGRVDEPRHGYLRAGGKRPQHGTLFPGQRPVQREELVVLGTRSCRCLLSCPAA